EPLGVSFEGGAHRWHVPPVDCGGGDGPVFDDEAAPSGELVGDFTAHGDESGGAVDVDPSAGVVVRCDLRGLGTASWSAPGRTGRHHVGPLPPDGDERVGDALLEGLAIGHELAHSASIRYCLLACCAPISSRPTWAMLGGSESSMPHAPERSPSSSRWLVSKVSVQLVTIGSNVSMACLMTSWGVGGSSVTVPPGIRCGRRRLAGTL